MKILSLRFKNLNSLQGEWNIDFSVPEYAANGIFAITGPTGAGKSTILDAICLALYGITPRLERVNQASNEIMSRQTSECFAEVVFESQAGRFCCHWSQRKAHNRVDGNLLASKHEISDAATGKPLENKRNLVVKLVEEKTGMDFERFTRSIMLAQGEFTAFLKANAGERAPILEQITGTDIYGQISTKVFERQRDENTKLNVLKAETSGIIFLSDEEEAKAAEDLALKQQEETGRAAEQLANNKALQWLNGIATLRSDLSKIATDTSSIDEKIELFKPTKEKLSRAVKAAELDGDFASLKATRQQQSADQETLKNNKDKFPQQELLLAEQEKLLKGAEQATIGLKTRQKEEAPIIQQVRSFDLRTAEKAKLIEEAGADCKKNARQIAENQGKLSQLAMTGEAAEKEIKTITAYLADNANDEALVTQFSAITELVGNLQAFSEDLAARKTSLDEGQKLDKKLAKGFKAKEKEFKAITAEYEKAQNDVARQTEALNKLLGERKLSEYRSDYSALLKEMGYLKKIASYEEERKKLQDGKACQLCGSTEHPFAKGNVPEVDEVEKRSNEISKLIEAAEVLEATGKELQENEKKLLKKLADVDKKFAQSKHEKETSDKSLKQMANELEAAEKKSAKAREGILAKLKAHGILEIADENVAAILASLQKRLQLWNSNQTRKGELEKQLNQLAAETSNLNVIITTITLALNEKNIALTALNAGYAQLLAERKALYGTKNPEEEESQLEKQITKAEKAEKQAREGYDLAKNRLHEIKTLINSLEENIGKRLVELDSLEKAFVLSLSRTGFTDEAAFQACRLSAEQRQEMSERARELENKKAEIATRKSDRETSLAQELEKRVTESSVETLQIAISEGEAVLKAFGEEIGGLKQKLADNKNAKELIKDKKVLIDRQDLECQKWNRLHLLIGSQNGNRFRVFAQGLTFELVISQANQQLAKMTDRYLLIRDKQEPLDLNVVDNYQAGEIRSTKNLSGGESFIVSLALALGLSKMASRKVRVDSLFLDEGFGSLDEEALETALSTLSGLQQDGKLIGVISHVAALKERITTQINVQPGTGGKSSISGPGVSKK